MTKSSVFSRNTCKNNKSRTTLTYYPTAFWRTFRIFPLVGFRTGTEQVFRCTTPKVFFLTSRTAFKWKSSSPTLFPPLALTTSKIGWSTSSLSNHLMSRSVPWRWLSSLKYTHRPTYVLWTWKYPWNTSLRVAVSISSRSIPSCPSMTLSNSPLWKCGSSFRNSIWEDWSKKIIIRAFCSDKCKLEISRFWVMS